MIDILILSIYTVSIAAGLVSVVWINSELRKNDGKIILENEKENEK